MVFITNTCYLNVITILCKHIIMSFSGLGKGDPNWELTVLTRLIFNAVVVT